MPAEAPDEKRAASSVHVEPYIPAGTHLPEFTPRALILGTILGMVFGASSLYLVLKVGLTVSASIPVAVISLTLFRLGSRVVGFPDATILENNIAQTAGSAGESIAFGVGVTMPSIMILGFDLELTRVMLVAILGGALGILMMIPLRRFRNRAGVQDPDGRTQIVEGHAGESVRCAVQSRVRRHGDFARIARRRLHHRAAHRFHHVRWRRARLSGPHSADQIFRGRS